MGFCSFSIILKKGNSAPGPANLIADYRPGWTIVNSEVFFCAQDDSLGSDLCKTDGTSAGTKF